MASTQRHGLDRMIRAVSVAGKLRSQTFFDAAGNTNVLPEPNESVHNPSTKIRRQESNPKCSRRRTSFGAPPNHLFVSIDDGICRRVSRLFARSVKSILHLRPSRQPFRFVSAPRQSLVPLHGWGVGAAKIGYFKWLQERKCRSEAAGRFPRGGLVCITPAESRLIRNVVEADSL